MYFYLNSKLYRLENIINKSVIKINLFQILNYFGYETEYIIVEYNKSIVESNFYKKIVINDSDTIQIISIVGGG